MRNLITFIRWRLIIVRYLTRLFNIRWVAFQRNVRPSTSIVQIVADTGFYIPKTSKNEIGESTIEMYRSRASKIEGKGTGAPFENLVNVEDISPDSEIFKLAFSPSILDVAADYFGGNFILDSIQVLYSWPQKGSFRESQLWHKDYGDSKSFHAIVYLSDVLSISEGPFVFVDKKQSKRIKKSLTVRRIEDEQFERELQDGKVTTFLSEKGGMVYVDPACCYHHGSRCATSRLALFVTFNSSMPFVAPQKFISSNHLKIFDTAKVLRPDLSENYLYRLIAPKVNN